MEDNFKTITLSIDNIKLISEILCNHIETISIIIERSSLDINEYNRYSTEIDSIQRILGVLLDFDPT